MSARSSGPGAGPLPEAGVHGDIAEVDQLLTEQSETVHATAVARAGDGS
ncbi:hypothetical protein [Streptomyces sp. Tu 6176]|nr:hypothetical protein [Streptomyces sp. Tu 6176]